MNKNMPNYNKARSGIKDVWNAYMFENAVFEQFDIPFCPTTAKELPKRLIVYTEAKSIYKREICKDENFKEEAFVCFYEDDSKFDSLNGIWNKPYKSLEILKHFAGVITPDFSTYLDFPLPELLHNTYKMRGIGFWYGKNGIPVINNVRWGFEESFCYCFNGIPKNSVVAIGTVASELNKRENYKIFEKGLYKLIELKRPRIIIVYGSIKYPCFEVLKFQGIEIHAFKSATAEYFEKNHPYVGKIKRTPYLFDEMEARYE